MIADTEYRAHARDRIRGHLAFGNVELASIVANLVLDDVERERLAVAVERRPGYFVRNCIPRWLRGP